MNLLNKRLVVIVISTAAILLLTAVLAGLYLMHVPVPSPPEFMSPTSQAEANAQDLAYVKKALHEVDRGFSPDEWVKFDRAIDDLSKRADTLDAAMLEMGIARAVAMANNGHTNLIAASWGLTLNSIPLRFYWFSDGLYVVRADPAHSDLLGAKVLTLGRHTPQELAERLRRYVGGRQSFSRELSIHFMESPQAMNAIGLLDSATTARLTLETIHGEVMERSVAALPSPVNGSPPQKYLWPIWPRRILSPAPVPGDERQWAHVLDQRKVPFALRQPNRLYRAAYLAQDQVLFLQIDGTIDDPGHEPLEIFLEHALEEVAAKQPQFAIVDLRSNPGGSYGHTTSFTRKLPLLIPENGKIFILTSGNTFSAGIITTARLKHFSGPRGEIVGEPMGDYPQFWAEAAARIVLPNSALRIGYATKYHDWQDGCSIGQILICYPMNYFLGVAANELDPTVSVSWSFADYLQGKDTAVEKVLQIIAGSLPSI